MKLIVLMSIEEYADVLRKILINHRIPVFSETDVDGYKLSESEHLHASWFSGKQSGIYSHMFIAFVNEQKSDEVLSAIEVYNESHEQLNPLRGFQLDVERGV